MSEIKRIVLLVTSPRMPAGLLTFGAWDLVRAHPVYARAEDEQTVAIRSAGAQVKIMPTPDIDVLLDNAPCVWLAGPQGDEQFARQLGLRLAREPALAELELMYGSWDPPGARLLDAVAVTDRLRAEDPWKREQTHRTLAKYLLEEAYEAYDAILSGDYEALRDEMGDVLLQVLLHSRLAEELPEDERWNIDDVAGDFVDKMVRRNPHVFATINTEISSQEVVEEWERIKQIERPRQSLVDGLTWSLPSLILATKLLSRARSAGMPLPQDAGNLGERLLALVAATDEDAEASLRDALTRYAELLRQAG